MHSREEVAFVAWDSHRGGSSWAAGRAGETFVGFHSHLAQALHYKHI